MSNNKPLNKSIRLAKNFQIGASEFASQANAILGIRDSGKTYTAMKSAEECLEANIPITVYDPVGVWRNLRSGINGHKGYPIIVAGGGEGDDILLTPDNAVQIVRAAMIAGISIIIDLYSVALSNKSKWIKIVQETIDVLMYENRGYGLRHVYIEEAAEFIPQRVQPQQGKVYSSIERLARMGRNSSVGLTIINQRAEEVNKAILELCALIFLHKQVGKNSLLSIRKWLEIRESSVDISKVMSRITKLNKGETFVVGSEGLFQEIKVLPKNTYHPSPEKGVPAKVVKSTVNISSFIKKLNEQLASNEESKQKKRRLQDDSKTIAGRLKDDSKTISTDPSALREKDATISQLKNSLDAHRHALEIANKELTAAREQLLGMQEYAKTIDIHIKGILSSKIPVSRVKVLPMVTVKAKVDTRSRDESSSPKLPSSGKKMWMAKGVAMHPEGIRKDRLAVICGMSPTSGTYGVYYRQLRAEGLIVDAGGMFQPTESGIAATKQIAELPTSPNDLLVMWADILGQDSGLTRILRALAAQGGEWMDGKDVAAEAGMTSGSGTFGVYYRKLRRFGLIEIRKGEFRLSKNMLTA